MTMLDQFDLKAGVIAGSVRTVGQMAEVARMGAELLDRLPHIDVVVHNAGSGVFKGFLETTADELFTLKQVRCVGTCSLAPVVVVDENNAVVQRVE